MAADRPEVLVRNALADPCLLGVSSGASVGATSVLLFGAFASLGAQKEKFLETSPITRNLTAVKRRCFLPLSYDEITPGPRNAVAVAAVARWLHPAAFGRPPDGVP